MYGEDLRLFFSAINMMKKEYIILEVTKELS